MKIRRKDETRHNRSGGEALEEPRKEEITSEPFVEEDEEEDGFSWYSWPDF